MKDQNGDVIDTTYVKLRGTNEISADNTFTGLNTFDKGTADTYVYAGKTDSTKNNVFRARSNNTSIGLYANSDGSRGLWAYANGNAAAQGILKVDSNNDIFYNGGTFTSSNITKISTIDAIEEDNGISNAKYITNFSITDKNNLILSRLEHIADPSGTMTAYWYVRNYNGTTTYVAQKGIKMILDKAGTLTYSVSNPEKMRSALGVDGIFYGTCVTGQSTPAKVATLTSDKGFILTAGATVAIRFTQASAGSPMTLEVNGTGAKRLYQYGTYLMSSGTTTSGWPAGAVVVFVYDAELDGWTRIYWTNTTEPSNVTSRGTQAGLEAETSTNGGVGLSRYAVSMMTKNQKWSNIAHVEGSTAADQGDASAKTAATADFLLDSPIYYSSTNVYIAPGASGSMNGFNIGNFSFRRSIGTTSTAVNLVAPKPVYLVGIPNDDGATFKLYPTQWWTQNPNTFTDKAGKIFIYLGVANSASNIYMFGTHPIYYHDGTTFYPYVTSKKIFMGSNSSNEEIGLWDTRLTDKWLIMSNGSTTSISGSTLYHLKNGTSYIIPDGLNSYAADRIWGITVPTNPSNTYYANKTVELITDNNQLCLYNRTDSSMIWSIPVLSGGTSTLWPVSQGGTGASSFTTNQVIVSNSDTSTGAFTSRPIISATSSTHLNWGTDNNGLIDKTMLAYWNGAYSSANISNIKYLGTIESGVWNGSVIDIEHGGTGASTYIGAKVNLGLGSAAQNVWFSNYGGSDQLFGVSSIVVESSTTKTFTGRRAACIFKDNGIYMYDHDNSRQIWDMSISNNNTVSFYKRNNAGTVVSSFTLHNIYYNTNPSSPTTGDIKLIPI